MPDPVGRRRTPAGRRQGLFPMRRGGANRRLTHSVAARARSAAHERPVFIARRWAAGCTDGIRKEGARWRRGGGRGCGSLPEHRRRATTEPAGASREPARRRRHGPGPTGRSKSGTLRRRCTEEPRDRGAQGRDRSRRRHVRRSPGRGGHRPGGAFPQPRRVRAHVPARPDDGDANRAIRVRPRRRGPRDGGRTGPRRPARTTAPAQAAPGCLRI